MSGCGFDSRGQNPLPSLGVCVCGWVRLWPQKKKKWANTVSVLHAKPITMKAWVWGESQCISFQEILEQIVRVIGLKKGGTIQGAGGRTKNEKWTSPCLQYNQTRFWLLYYFLWFIITIVNFCYIYLLLWWFSYWMNMIIFLTKHTHVGYYMVYFIVCIWMTHIMGTLFCFRSTHGQIVFLFDRHALLLSFFGAGSFTLSKIS